MREIVLDTETTGLSFANDRIVEIAAVELFDRLPTGRTFHRHVNPEREVGKKALEIHGLSNEFLADKPLFVGVAAELLAFLGDAPLVIHNADFDTRMLNAEFERLCLPELANPVVDTLMLARQVKKPRPHNLDAMCEFYQIDTSRRVKHGALLDCELLAEVYLHLTGGRQRALDLPAVDVAMTIPAPDYGARRFVPRLTDDERAAHDRMLAGLDQEVGGACAWRAYLGSTDNAG